MNLIEKLIENFGLEEKEAKVYLALLGLGEATATAIAEKTNLDRTLMYQVTNKLIERGIVSYIVKNNVRYFSAIEPEVLIKSLKKRENELRKVLPELNSIKNSIKQKTKVEIYQGKEGTNTILREIIREEKDYFILGGATEACAIFELENIHFVQEAEKLKIKGKILARKNDNFFTGRNADSRFIPDELISSTTMMLWGNKTAVFIWTEPYNVIVIDNNEITQGNLATFNYLWNLGDKPVYSDRKKRLLKN